MANEFHKRIKVSTDDMRLAIKEGSARQSESEAKGYKPYGAGDYSTHITGRLGEIAFCRYIGVPVTDPGYKADLNRGCDVVGPDGTRYHIRSSKYRGSGMMIKPKDPAGIYVQVITTADGYCIITGWYTRTEAEHNYNLEGMRVNPAAKIWNIPQQDLHPFCMTGFAQAA